MKRILLVMTMVALAGSTVGFTACKKEKKNVTPATENSTTLSDAEKQSVLFTREEEKMARDVYTSLLVKWPDMNFLSNISASEQKHMDAVQNLINAYGLTDPVGDNAVGMFTNPDVQKLYNELVNKGGQSELEAVVTGLTIEDMDIYDLQQALLQVQKEDIKTVYSNLMNASKNHMREFYTQLQNRGGSYIPKYITQQEFDEIVNSPKQHGNGRGR